MKCLSVGYFGILSTVCGLGCLQAIPEYVEAWHIYLKNIFYPKISLWAEGHTALCLKIICIINKLSQNMCIVNTHILIYWYVRCDCKLWSSIWFYCIFCVFSKIFDEHSCLKCCIFTKLSEIVCMIIVHILLYEHDKCACRLWKVLWLNCVLCDSFYKHNFFTNCTLRQV